MIRKNLLEKIVIQTLHKKYKNAHPFPHIVIPHFLEEKKAKQLRRELLKLEYELKDSDLFTLYQSEDLTKNKNETIQRFYGLMGSTKIRGFFEKITGCSLKGIFDLCAAAYLDTCHLLPHNDQVEKRVLAYVLNLSEDFTKYDGGSLGFIGGKKSTDVSYIPTFNTLTIFEVTKDSFHRVEEVIGTKTRLSIGGWYY